MADFFKDLFERIVSTNTVRYCLICDDDTLYINISQTRDRSCLALSLTPERNKQYITRHIPDLSGNVLTQLVLMYKENEEQYA